LRSRRGLIGGEIKLLFPHLFKRKALPARFEFSFLGVGIGMRLYFNPPAPGGPASHFYVFLKNYSAFGS
jgi:hypothetical protein